MHAIWTVLYCSIWICAQRVRFHTALSNALCFKQYCCGAVQSSIDYSAISVMNQSTNEGNREKRFWDKEEEVEVVVVLLSVLVYICVVYVFVRALSSCIMQLTKKLSHVDMIGPSLGKSNRTTWWWSWRSNHETTSISKENPATPSWQLLQTCTACRGLWASLIEKRQWKTLNLSLCVLAI